MGISDCYISTSGGLQTYQGSDGDRPNITIIYLLYHILPNKRRCFAEILRICTRLNIAELVSIWQLIGAHCTVIFVNFQRTKSAIGLSKLLLGRCY